MGMGLFIAWSEAAGGAAGDVVGGVDEEGEGGEEVVVALGGVYEEVDGLVGPDYALCFGDLGPELGGLGGAVGLVGVEPAGVDGGEEVEAEVGLAAGGEVEGFDDGGSETLYAGRRLRLRLCRWRRRLLCGSPKYL